jgi:hypothetical protein
MPQNNSGWKAKPLPNNFNNSHGICPRCATSIIMCKCRVVKTDTGRLLAVTAEQCRELKKTGSITKSGRGKP